MGTDFSLDKKRIARSFGNAATLYDQYAELQREVADNLLQGLEPKNIPTTIMDLGSGTGYCTGIISLNYPQAKILSVDIAEQMLVHSRNSLDRLPLFVCGDASSLPFQNSSIDLIVSSLSIQWIENFDSLFRELSRVTADKGSVCLSTFVPGTLQELKSAWSLVDDYVHVNTFESADVLAASAIEAGFVNQVIEEVTIMRFYASFQELARELKSIGAHNVNKGQPRGLGGKDRLRKIQTAFEANRISGQGIPVTYKVLYMQLSR